MGNEKKELIDLIKTFLKEGITPGVGFQKAHVKDA